MRFLLLSLLLVIGFWEGQGGRASVRRKRQLIDYHRDLRCSFWGLDCLAVGSYTVIRNDEGNQITTALVVLPDYGDISSPTNTQRSQAQTAISQLTDGMLQNDPNLFITGLTTVGTSDNGVRIDQQGKTSDGLYRNIAVQTNTRLNSNSVNIAQALIPISNQVLLRDARRALVESLDRQAVVRLQYDFYVGDNFRRYF